MLPLVMKFVCNFRLSYLLVCKSIRLSIESSKLIHYNALPISVGYPYKAVGSRFQGVLPTCPEE